MLKGFLPVAKAVAIKQDKCPAEHGSGGGQHAMNTHLVVLKRRGHELESSVADPMNLVAAIMRAN